MDILVTGAGGQLAYDLIPRLDPAGFSVLGLDSTGLDITDREKVLKAVGEARPGFIINCAAYTKVDLAEKERERAFAVNRNGAANLAAAAKEAGAPLIHVSTDFVFDGSKSTPYREDDRANPLCAYGESKLAGEEEVIKALGEHIIIRASWLYGAHGNNFVKTIIRHASERDSLRVVYDQAGGPTWTVDLCGAIIEVLNALKNGGKAYGVYHYSDEGVASWYDFAEEIVEAAKEKTRIRCKKIEPIRSEEYPTPARRPAYSVMDKRKIKETFGVDIPHWRRSLRRMIGGLAWGAE